jgi:hypothetical protein
MVQTVSVVGHLLIFASAVLKWYARNKLPLQKLQ